MVKLFLLTWYASAFDCPWGLGKLPALAKSFICQKSERVEVYSSPYAIEAERKIRELGPGTKVRYLEVSGASVNEVRVLWSSVLELGDK